LKGVTQKVGKLGELLGEYEKEREAERERELRRERTAERFVPEDTDSEEDEAMAVDLNAEETLLDVSRPAQTLQNTQNFINVVGGL